MTPTEFAQSATPAKAMAESTVEDLAKPESNAKLTAILTYHAMAADVSGRKLEHATVNWVTLHVDGTSGVTINGAYVVSADIPCTKGLIQVIDTVLMPKVA